ncbi:hypothetical protein DAPPUDRAFT_115343 [Daphnia pulex]|uniref:Uncharacterized protein n=1 Tax=Daphnia pulex TaxID=6669 RepID=E9HL21_DAPPU|nr:hypothetical protein DAPPUDRAFT_115343 [Daphnia pulex]|eukprot:EFX67569.1 hypothetical protein DAPPUDRAFT_115343 [Daphnia pulex]
MATAQLPVITEESASVAEQEQSTVVDPKTMDRSQLVQGQFKDEARKLRMTLVQEYENVELCHNLVLAACATQEKINKEFCWFETFTEAHRKMLADINAYLGEGLANLKPAGSIRSRSSRASSRNSAQSKEDKIQEKAWKVAETELRLKQAQEEARLREIEEEKIWLLEEDKRKEELKASDTHRGAGKFFIQINFSSLSSFLGSTAAREFSSRQGSAGKNQGFFFGTHTHPDAVPPERPSPTAPAPPPPRCEASDQNQFLRQLFSGSNENWERTIEQDDGRYAETLGNKAVSQSVSATFLNPLAGAFEPRAGFFSLP